MEEKKPQTLITSSEVILQADLLSPPPRLTPTGKISHAKTRVYTQRYRKQWEEMPDFKGWLTSVPFQPTRAFCTYCKKNLHAHRLSLLKHTCTMKHQRSALMHEGEQNAKKEVAANTRVEDVVEIMENEDNSQIQTDDNDEEVEYVIEKLDMDEDEMEDCQERYGDDMTAGEEEEEEEAEAEDESDHQELKPILKKIKVEVPEESQQDALARAMAHVHGEYLEEAEEQGNVQMEMVVESPENQNSQEVQIMSILPDMDDANNDTSKEANRSEKAISHIEVRSDKKNGIKLTQEKAKAQTDQSGVVMACPLPVLGTTYQISTSGTSHSGTIGVLQPVNTIPLVSAQSKTITLTTSGKMVTLTGGTFTPGTQYVINKVKGKFPTIMMAEKKAVNVNNQAGDVKPTLVRTCPEQAVTTPGTSQQSSKKLLLKPVKSHGFKKSRISTHVVDSTKGLPVGGLQVSLYKLMDGRWTFLNESNTAPNGRCTDLVDEDKIAFTAGRYKLHFDVDKYFTLRRIETMYPFIEIVFDVKDPTGHYHIPVLLSPFGYTTYRGSER